MSKNEKMQIWTMVEIHQGVADSVSWELIGAARQAVALGQENAGCGFEYEVTAVVIGEKVKAIAQEAIAYGADRVMMVDHERCGTYINEVYQHALYEMLAAGEPDIFLIGATTQGRDLASGVAAQLGGGLTADCTQMVIDPPKEGMPCLLMATRPAFSGNLMATIVCETARPQMATVRPHVFAPLVKDETRTGEIVPFDVKRPLTDDRVKVLAQEFVAQAAGGIEFADVIVAGGRGIGGKEGLALLQELAEVLGGKLAVTRACVDANWASHEIQVGLTGKTVNPALYIACGISGAVQHRVGMQNSQKIIAVNQDAEAPIFSIADVGIVGNLFEIVPEMIAQVKAMKTGMGAE